MFSIQISKPSSLFRLENHNRDPVSATLKEIRRYSPRGPQEVFKFHASCVSTLSSQHEGAELHGFWSTVI